MAETFEAYRTRRFLSYLGDGEPIGVQQATPSQLDRRLRDVAPDELIRRPAPEKWSIAEIVAALGGRGAGDGVAIAKHAGESGRRLNVSGIRPCGRSAWVTRSKMRGCSAGVFRALRESGLRPLESGPAHGGWSTMGSTRNAGQRAVRVQIRLEAAHDLSQCFGRSTASWVGVCSGSRLAANASASVLSGLWR